MAVPGFASACAGGGDDIPGVELAAAGAAQLSEQEERRIVHVLKEQQDAWNRGDLDGFMRGYWNSPDLVFTSGGRLERGYERLLERYRTVYGAGADLGRLEFSDLEVHRLGPGSAWVLGRWRLARGEELQGGIFTLVMKKMDDMWTIVHDHTSADAAGPAAAPSPGAPPAPGAAAPGPPTPVAVPAPEESTP